MIELVPTGKKDRAVWETIIDITDWFPAPWTLIGARMVQLHAMSGGREVPRVSLDADALADVRAMPGATAKLSATLIEHGFELDDDPQGGQEATLARRPRAGYAARHWAEANRWLPAAGIIPARFLL